jgi:hypothetical protein
MTLGMSEATPADSGLVSGLLNTTQQVGGSLGLAVLATIATWRTAGLLESGQGAAAALTGGYRLAFVVSAVLVAAAAVVAATVLRPGATAAGAAGEPDLEAAA